MKPKQKYNPLINPETSDFVSPNRRTYRQLKRSGLETERVGAAPASNPDKKIGGNKLTREMREAIARDNGSTTGKLKGKHIWRQKEKDHYENLFIDLETFGE